MADENCEPGPVSCLACGLGAIPDHVVCSISYAGEVTAVEEPGEPPGGLSASLAGLAFQDGHLVGLSGSSPLAGDVATLADVKRIVSLEIAARVRPLLEVLGSRLEPHVLAMLTLVLLGDPGDTGARAALADWLEEEGHETAGAGVREG